MKELGRMARDRFFVILAAVIVTALAVGGAALTSVAESRPNDNASDTGKLHATASHTPEVEATETESEGEGDGVHGGPMVRNHDAACNLTDTSKLAGNWTHGDYVAAVAAGGDSAKTKQAAQSDCGKVVHPQPTSTETPSGHPNGHKHGNSADAHANNPTTHDD